MWNPKWKWTCESGIDFPQNTWPVEKNVGGDNLWSRSTKFENIVEFLTFICGIPQYFLVPKYFLWNRICEFHFRKHSIVWLLFCQKVNFLAPNGLHMQISGRKMKFQQLMFEIGFQDENIFEG